MTISELLRQLLDLADAGTPDELWEMLVTALNGYGFDRISYGATRVKSDNSFGEAEDVVYLSNIGGNASDGMAFFMRTPMFRWVMQNRGACSWQWSEDQLRNGLLSPEEASAREHARKAGFIAGWSISFVDPSPRNHAAMLLCAAPGRIQAEVDAQWARDGKAIMALCQTMHLRLQTLPLPVARRPLSPRQREALRWVAEGKTMQDVAAIMGVSAAMVEKHLRLAREALDVETTAHAVAKASLFNQLYLG